MYGLIGKKIGHSFSAQFFNEKFKREGIPEEYFLFPLENISLLPELIETHSELKGLNVTIPYKSSVIPYLNRLSDEAKAMGAVNVIKIIRNKDNVELVGYNSDSIGFRESLLPILRHDIKKALVLGTGGASKAVEYVLSNLGIKVTKVSRTPKENELRYDELSKEIMEENLLIVNTTPLGMFPDVDTMPPIPYNFLTPDHICYDVVYNPIETKFLKESTKAGALTKNGIDMLHLQAIGAWNIWSE